MLNIDINFSKLVFLFLSVFAGFCFLVWFCCSFGFFGVRVLLALCFEEFANRMSRTFSDRVVSVYKYLFAFAPLSTSRAQFVLIIV